MLEGGYRMIDLYPYDISVSADIRKDIFKDLQKVDKPILLTGIYLNGKPKAPIFVENNDNVIKAYGYKLTFTETRMESVKIEGV